jgi:hypothetical protein
LRERRSQALFQLKELFFQLSAEPDRRKAEFALEKFLNQLFELFDLRPRQAFRIIGEQIDGSFELDGQIYLIESKWAKDPLSEADLLVFRGKIEGKSAFTRGVFIALNDISSQARDAFTRGKAPSFFIMNGHDLMMILCHASHPMVCGACWRSPHDCCLIFGQATMAPYPSFPRTVYGGRCTQP